MADARWAAFSVVAHADTPALARDVLLYDKLILPYPSDEAEERLWADKGWKPELLQKRIEELNDLAEPYNWNQGIREKFTAALATMRDEVHPMAATPLLIRRWIQSPLREQGIRVVAAFRSEEAFRQDYLRRADAASAGAVVAFAIAEEVAVPYVSLDPETALRHACELARDEEFRKHRRNYYRWQDEVGERIAAGKIDIEGAKAEMRDLLDTYNKRVLQADRKAKKTIVVTLAGTAAAIAGALLTGPVGWSTLLAGAGATSLFLVDRDVNTAGLEPAVMFHDMHKALH